MVRARVGCGELRYNCEEIGRKMPARPARPASPASRSKSGQSTDPIHCLHGFKSPVTRAANPAGWALGNNSP